MAETENSRGRLARIVLAVALAVVAIRSFRNGKRATGVLAGLGAGALGYSATAEEHELTEEINIETPREDDSAGESSESDSTERTGSVDSSDTSDEDGRLRCAACGDPIVLGQRRGPNADNEIVHRTCMTAQQ
ncbi:MAG: DUF2892 domain-containing protein [Haloarculaceae archaeon]